MNKAGRTVTLLTAAVLAFACGAGGSGSGSATAAVAGGTMTYRINGDFRTFDPQVALVAPDVWLMNNVYSQLIYQDNTGKLVPYMAKSWKVTPTSVAFTLKPGMTCADGTPITASVVRDSFQLMIDRKLNYNTLLWGPGPYSLSADATTNVFTFSTAAPFADLVRGFTQVFPANQTGIVCPAGVKDYKQLATRTFGSGAYTIADAVHGDHVTFKLRPEFN